MPPPKPEQEKEKDKKPLTPQEKRLMLRRRALRRKRIMEMREAAMAEDNEAMIEGLSPDQLQTLAQKVFDLWRDELRLEDERFGRLNFR